MEQHINSHIRPMMSPDERVETFNARLTEEGIVASASIRFTGWVTEISVADPEVLNEFRLLHHLERYSFTADYLKECGDSGLQYFDIGIGEAHGVLHLLKRSPPELISRVVGIEIDPGIAASIRSAYPQFDVVQGNIEEAEVAGSFDVISCFELIGNESLSSDEALLTRLDRLCAPGGRLFISIAGFDSTAHGRELAKSYSARIYNGESFQAMVRRSLPAYKLEYFGQIYPLKRMFASQVGVWPNPGLAVESDFLICVAEKPA